MHKINSERDRMKQMSHIRNLWALAITDGSFDNQEKELVYEIGIRSGLTADELKMILKNPASVSYVKPDSNVEKVEQLYDLVLLIWANDKITPNETSLCKAFAVKLGIELKTVNKLLPALIESISKGEDTEGTITRLLTYFD